MIFELTECEEKLGYKFKDVALFRTCFTHSSYTNEHSGLENNERLEFFGDAILDFIVTEYLMEKFPDCDEGVLTEKRKNYVSKGPLTKTVFNLGLDKYIMLGRGVENDRDPNEKFYSSIYESVVAGIYIDGGMAQAKKFVLRTLIKDVEKKPATVKKVVKKQETPTDYKSALQEFMQKRKMGVPVYKSISRVGPDNSPIFTEAVLIDGKIVAKGCAKTKKQAQQIGAQAVYEKLLKGQSKSTAKKAKKVAEKQTNKRQNQGKR